MRPHTLIGHMNLYKATIHNSNNTLPKWYLEALGVYTSSLNKCEYCVVHHTAGLRRLLNDDELTTNFLQKAKEDNVDGLFDSSHDVGFAYAKQITLNLDSSSENDIQKLRDAGFSDGEVLEINQVVSYFNYVNRMVVSLGVNIAGDIIGLSPNNSDDPNQWNHD
ncbi:MAG: putative peroxidase-related enzyme [Arenicella sp.]